MKAIRWFTGILVFAGCLLGFLAMTFIFMLGRTYIEPEGSDYQFQIVANGKALKQYSYVYEYFIDGRSAGINPTANSGAFNQEGAVKFYIIKSSQPYEDFRTQAEKNQIKCFSQRDINVPNCTSIEDQEYNDYVRSIAVYTTRTFSLKKFWTILGPQTMTVDVAKNTMTNTTPYGWDKFTQRNILSSNIYAPILFSLTTTIVAGVTLAISLLQFRKTHDRSSLFIAIASTTFFVLGLLTFLLFTF